MKTLGGTRDYRLFQSGRLVRVRPAACKCSIFDVTGKLGTLGKARGLGRFNVQLEDGRRINVEGKYLEFV